MAETGKLAAGVGPGGLMARTRQTRSCHRILSR